MIRFCIICGKPLMGRQTKLCSDKECHKERKNEYHRKYRQNNRERERMRSREYRQNNPEKAKESGRNYYQNNLEREREHSREYYQNNIEKKNKYDYRRYRRNLGLPEDADLYKETSIERIIREWLQENDIEFEVQYFINLENSTWTRIDFYIPDLNVCLYVDGDYWHSLPEVQERDIKINKALEEMGYGVIRMAETEILEENGAWCRLAQCLGVDGNGTQNAG